MCGICGVFDKKAGQENNAALAKRMAQQIEHRGPDGDGFYLEGPIALGHRRLSIIDLEGGDQPIYNETKDIAIVFNGEIYNYKEIRERLIAKGHKLYTSSDTEVIVHLYEEMGEDCLQELNGMFTFAIWDKRKQKLFVGRDRLGEKPLYYHFDNGRLVFASELKALLADSLVPRQLNMNAVEMYLSYGYIPQPHSIYKNIKKLPAAHFLTLSNNNLKISPYWRIKMAPALSNMDEQEALDELELLLKDSVKLRLRSDVPVGAFLSGGIDSSLMVSLAAEQTSRLQTFTVGFTEKDFDEVSFARTVAKRYGTEHHEFQVNNLDPNLFPQLVRQFDEPFADSSAVPTHYVTKEAATKVKVCISGDGGDELFCGYTRYNLEKTEFINSILPQSVRSRIFGPVSDMLPLHLSGKGSLSRLASSGAQRWQRSVGPFEDKEVRSLMLSSIEPSNLFDKYFGGEEIDEISQRMWADQETYLPDDILVKVDRTSMWHSLEVRVPFLDHRIVEFANTLPISLKKKDDSLKYLIKKLVERRLPREVIDRPKKGFSLPIRHWLNSSLSEFAAELLLSNDSRTKRFLNQDHIRNLLASHKKGQRDLSRRIWTILWLEQWCREFDF